MARELPLDETEQELFKVGREVCPMSVGQEPSSKSESDAEQEKTQPGFQKNRRDPLDAWPGEGAPGLARSGRWRYAPDGAQAVYRRDLAPGLRFVYGGSWLGGG